MHRTAWSYSPVGRSCWLLFVQTVWSMTNVHGRLTWQSIAAHCDVGHRGVKNDRPARGSPGFLGSQQRHPTQHTRGAPLGRTAPEGDGGWSVDRPDVHAHALRASG